MANRRNIIIGAGAAVVAAVGVGAYFLTGKTETATAVEGALPPPAPGATFDVGKLMSPAGGYTDRVLGNKESKAVLIEYLSPSCPHCAAFALNVLPQLKTAYIDTNKIAFIPRPFVRNLQDAVVFMLATAAGEARYDEVIETFFKTQAQWETDTPYESILKVAEQLGFTKETYEAALTNQALFNSLDAVKKQAVEEFKLQGTPTFYINGKMLSGENSFDALKAEIDPLLA